MTEPEEEEQEENVTHDVAEDIALERASAEQLYQGGFLMTHPARWTRMREQVRFEDVVGLFQPMAGQVISCPFHGRDSKPSFNLYRRTNDAFCFGCPPGKQYYDHVRFVAAKLGGTPVQALDWLEKQFNLPRIADVDQDGFREDQVEEFVSLTFPDLKERFITHARERVSKHRDTALAREYLEILFAAWPTRREQEADPNAGDVLPLARVLGRKAVDQLLRAKVQKLGVLHG